MRISDWSSDVCSSDLLGLPTAELTEAVRQQTQSMKAAVASARSGDYAASLQSLDKIVSGEGADKLAANLVAEWTRLKPENRDKTNILVLDNATRLIVNTQIREVRSEEHTSELQSLMRISYA